MKILFFLHDVVLGGTTVNAVDLARTLRDRHGHEVTFFSTPGPMVKLVEESGLRFLPAPFVRHHPSPARMRALRSAVGLVRPDLIYAWETWPCFDAYYGVHLPMGVPMLVTDMQMSVTRRLPKSVMTTFGTPELVDQARAQGRRRVELLLPPIDVQMNSPGLVDGAEFRRRWGITGSDITLVMVSRLVESMKGEGLARVIQAVRTLGRRFPLKLLVVGDGEARGRIAQLAREANEELGYRAVSLTGAMLDPRVAYAAADIVLGMGSSSLRGMAFGKPVIVVGERGFSAPFTPDTAEDFYYRGLYGIGDGDSGNTRLIAHIEHLVGRPGTFGTLGEFSRNFVEQRFSLEVVSARLSELCGKAVTERPGGLAMVTDALRTTAIYLRERAFRFSSVPQAPMELQDAKCPKTSHA